MLTRCKNVQNSEPVVLVLKAGLEKLGFGGKFLGFGVS